jgi:hypothetical protein
MQIKKDNRNLGTGIFIKISFLEIILAFIVICAGINKISNSSVILNENDHPAMVKIFDLNAELKPKEIYDSIACINSTEVYVVTTLCIHAINRDKYLTHTFMDNGIWELDIMSNHANF